MAVSEIGKRPREPAHNRNMLITGHELILIQQILRYMLKQSSPGVARPISLRSADRENVVVFDRTDDVNDSLP